MWTGLGALPRPPLSRRCKGFAPFLRGRAGAVGGREGPESGALFFAGKGCAKMFGDTDRCGMEGSIVVYDVDTDRIERQLRVLRHCVAVRAEPTGRSGGQEGEQALVF